MAQVDLEVGDNFDKRIRSYFQDHGYKFETHVSNTIQVRAGRGGAGRGGGKPPMAPSCRRARGSQGGPGWTEAELVCVHACGRLRRRWEWHL
jgi:hypothetical protein